MRTTIGLDDHLLKEARRVAAAQHRSLASLVEEALRQMLAAPAQKPGERSPVVLPEAGTGGLRSGIDLNNNADLLSVMERTDDSYGR